MGKVRDEAPAKATKAAKPAAGRRSPGWLAPFVANLFRGDILKPTQGRQARTWTAAGLGLLVAAGLYRLERVVLADSTPLVRIGVPAGLGLVLAWLVFRLVQYPPFVDFLIATEAEMRKVSWTSRADLYRATTVVLVTVLIIAVYLFGVDWAWSWLLRLIGVLRFEDSGGLGSQAG
jgi:preprotein translocase subunit SecE